MITVYYDQVKPLGNLHFDVMYQNVVMSRASSSNVSIAPGSLSNADSHISNLEMISLSLT